MSLSQIKIALQNPTHEEVMSLIEAEVERRTTVVTGPKGSQVTIPAGMTLAQAIKFLQKKEEAEEKEVVLQCEFPMFPLDVARAIRLALEERYNATLEDRMGFWGPQPPAMITVQTGPGTTEEVPWGDFSIANVEGKFSMHMSQRSETDAVFVLVARIKGRYQRVFTELVELVKEKLKTDSIYRGKALRVDFRDEYGNLRPLNQDFVPEFMDLTEARSAIFNRMTEMQINTSIFSPIRNAKSLREIGSTLRRTILLSGPYGTGKTLTALMTAKLCIENGWTFINVADPRDLARARNLARMFGPTVVFCEDIDRVMRGERTIETDKVLNQLDGIDTKELDIITVLTTNHCDVIQQPMRRPGRIDDKIDIDMPNADTCLRLLKLYGGDLLQGEDSAFTAALQPIVGTPPAMVREVIDRAKLAAVDRGSDIRLTPDDVEIAANTMRSYIDFMRGNDLVTEEKVDGLDLLATRIADRMSALNDGAAAAH